jgi:hypothetical protein
MLADLITDSPDGTISTYYVPPLKEARDLAANVSVFVTVADQHYREIAANR